MLKAIFACGYAGETDYDIRDMATGRIVTKVAVRDGAWINFGWNGDYFETGIKPTIGTVRFYSSTDWHNFPSAEIVALFPGYVGARFTTDYAVEYDGPAPVLADPQHGYLAFIGSERFAVA